MRNGIFILTSWPWKYGGTAAQKVLNESYGLQAMQAPYGKRVLMVIIGGLTTAVFFWTKALVAAFQIFQARKITLFQTQTHALTRKTGPFTLFYCTIGWLVISTLWILQPF
jgi:hypothetical protein